MMPQEQQVRQLVRDTLTQVGQIENGRLAHLMPAIPQKKRPFWPTHIAQPMASQLAMAAMLLVLLLGGWHWFSNENSAVWQTIPTSVAVTATTTTTPAATQTEAKIVATETAVRQASPAPAIKQTPAPLPTPVAAVLNRTLSN
ncbi:MAG: hypothetical protein H6654_02220 [Ardenticatenaceae bacterium]|nr:hypothetical protein [Ardenticatenaceae bacterium]